MKRIISALLVVAAVLALALIPSCGKKETPENINLYVLAGPTGIGAANLAKKASLGETENKYTVTVASANDEIVAAVSNGSADIAAVATNMASVLYNKTEGKIKVLAVNTLGVLYVLTNGQDVSSVADLKGKTIYAPGQGANPEYILKYVLEKNGLDPEKDVNISFVAEGSELPGVWAKDADAVIMAPQPVATSIQMKYENAKVALDMTAEWGKVSTDSTLMMGCVIVRTEFLEKYPDAVKSFLVEYEQSIKDAKENAADAGKYCEEFGIVPKAALATKAIPYCSLTYVAGADMKKDLSGYLKVMFEYNPASVGGKMPDADFYY